jgi:Xaa-Pro dipeptidase
MVRRLEKLHSMMQEHGLDAVAVVPGSNLRYLTGIDLPFLERPTLLFLPAKGDATAIMPFLELESWSAADIVSQTISWRDETGYEGAFLTAAERFVGGAIGVEGQRMRVFEYLAMQKAFSGSAIQDGQGLFSKLRLRKDEREVAHLRMAIGQAEMALEGTIAEVRVGMTETEIQAILSAKINAMPAVKLVVEPLVLAGSNAARPHGHARSDYGVKQGDVLLIDFGITCEGYWSDITRTFFIKDVSADHRAFYETVRVANEIGRNAVRPGVTAHDIDDSVQRYLEDSPYAEFIVHKTGHGIGLDVHESPQIMRGNYVPIEPDMVFTIEPGLYSSGDIGVRIEDDVLVTEDGVESLSRFPRELMVIG